MLGSHNPKPGARCARELSGVRGALETDGDDLHGHVLGTELSFRVRRRAALFEVQAHGDVQDAESTEQDNGRKRGWFSYLGHLAGPMSGKSSEPPVQVHWMFPRCHKKINTKAQRRKGTKETKEARLNLLSCLSLSLRAFASLC